MGPLNARRRGAALARWTRIRVAALATLDVAESDADACAHLHLGDCARQFLDDIAYARGTATLGGVGSRHCARQARIGRRRRLRQEAPAAVRHDVVSSPRVRSPWLRPRAKPLCVGPAECLRAPERLLNLSPEEDRNATQTCSCCATSEGQTRRARGARGFVVGAGGLGPPLCDDLAAAGVGTLGASSTTTPFRCPISSVR